MEGQTPLGSDFRTRLLTALIGAPAVLLAIYIGSWVWAIAILVVSVVCAQELHRMVDPADRFSMVALSIATLALILAFPLHTYLPAALVLALFLLVQAVLWFRAEPVRRPEMLRHTLLITFAALYIGLPLSLLLPLRGLDRGFEWTIMAFANNWATDGFALVGGRIAGRHKLAPRISPGKTIEGALIGLLAGFLMGMFAAAVFQLPVGLSIAANVAVAFMTLLGDLLESWIKRMFAVKDAGSILPGHGGVLDRVDGLLLALPILYLILMLP